MIEKEKIDVIAAAAALSEQAIYDVFKKDEDFIIPGNVLELLRSFRFKKDYKTMAKTIQYLCRDLFYILEEYSYMEYGEHLPYEPYDAIACLTEFLAGKDS